MAQVAVIGLGAIGSVTAAALHSTGGHELLLCTRRPLPSLQVQTPGGAIVVAGRNLTRAAQGTPVDWVIVATKAYDAESAAEWFPRLAGPRTKIAILQNGVEHRERFARWTSGAEVLPVIIDCPAEKLADGLFLQRAPAQMVVEDTAQGQEFAGLFRGSTALVRLTSDFTTAAWKKLCLNSAGALSAVTRLPNRVIQVDGMEAVALAVIEKCAAAGRAARATLDEHLPEQILEGARSASPEGVNSMLADRLAGRSMEIDARNGAIVRFGQRLGVPTPLNAMLVALLRAVQE